MFYIFQFYLLSRINWSNTCLYVKENYSVDFRPNSKHGWGIRFFCFIIAWYIYKFLYAWFYMSQVFSLSRTLSQTYWYQYFSHNVGLIHYIILKVDKTKEFSLWQWKGNPSSKIDSCLHCFITEEKRRTLTSYPQFSPEI